MRTTSVTHAPFSRLLPAGQGAHFTFGLDGLDAFDGSAGEVASADSWETGRMTSGVAAWVR